MNPPFARRSSSDDFPDDLTFDGVTGSCAAPAASRAPSGAPTATDVVQSIQRSQAAASSLSQVGGSSVDTQLTPQALANMSDAQFDALYNEVMAKGDRQKLMDLFGH